MEMQSTWVTCSEGTWTQSGGLEHIATPNFCWASCAHRSFGEGRALAKGAGGVQAPSLSTGTKTTVFYLTISLVVDRFPALS